MVIIWKIDLLIFFITHEKRLQPNLSMKISVHIDNSYIFEIITIISKISKKYFSLEKKDICTILMVWLFTIFTKVILYIFALMIFWWPLQSVWPAAQKLPYSIDYVHKRWALGTCMWTMETSTLPRCNGEPLPSICVSLVM